MRMLGRVRRAVIGTAVAMVLVGVAGCSGQGSGEASSGGDVTINWWGFAPTSATANKYKAAFEAANPGIKLNFKVVQITDYPATLRPGLQSSNGPDVFPLAAGGAVAGAFLFEDVATDLTDLAVSTLGKDFKDKYNAGAVDQMTVNGKLLASPFVGVTAQYFWYNKDLFDKYGQKPPTTYDEWVNVCKVFKSNGIQCFVGGFGGDLPFGGELLRTIANSVEPGYYEKAIKGLESWDSPVITKSIEIMRNMQRDGIIQPDAMGIQQYPEANNLFQSQKAAMIQMGSWYSQYMPKDVSATAQQAAGVSSPKVFTQLPMPAPDLAGKGNYPKTLGEVDWGVAVSKKSKHPEEAKKFVKWLTMTKEGQTFGATVLEGIPTLRGVEPDWGNLNLSNPQLQEPALKQLIKDAGTTTETRNRWIGSETAEAILQMVQQTLTTHNSPEQIVKKTQDMAVPIYKK